MKTLQNCLSLKAAFLILKACPTRLQRPCFDTEQPSCYLTISNSNNILQLLERLFLSRIQHHVSTCSHFKPYQSAYRPNHSTETSLFLTTEYMLNFIDNGDSTNLVSLYFSAALNAIDHHILLDLLHTSPGICNSVLDWLSSYLENQKQFVSVGHFRSITTTCTTGVPHGSVLGPILFSLFVSPIAQIATKYGVR